MNTSRVPGISRNSGWQAVASELVEARARRQPASEVPATGAAAPAADDGWKLVRSA